MRRCKHPKWKIVARRFTPPVEGTMKYSVATADFVKDVTMGFTTIEEQCCECGKTDFRKVSGDQTSG